MPQSQPETARRETFGFTCRACSKCCPHKYIQVNPYEVARLAHFLNLTTGAFLDRYTEHGGAILKRDAEDSCVFLNDQGCAVHPARPLVCRLFPLGRRVAADGSEEWVRTVPHPECRGEFHQDGTIADYVAAQGAEPFLAAADDYVAWVRAAGAALDGSDEDPSEAAETLIDMDCAIAAHCQGAAEPSDLDARRRLHLDILYQFLGGQHD